MTHPDGDETESQPAVSETPDTVITPAAAHEPRQPAPDAGKAAPDTVITPAAGPTAAAEDDGAPTVAHPT
ncbi:hypothetical protein, partial [Tsukamurella soli]